MWDTMEIDELIEVLRAVKDGKRLEKREENGEWREQMFGAFPLVHGKWRIKPEPRQWIAYVDNCGMLIGGHVSCGINSNWKKIIVREVLE